MKSRHLVCAMAISVLGAASLLTAQAGPFDPPNAPGAPPTSRPARQPMTVDSPPNLERAMKMMQQMIKKISAQIDDKSQDASTLVAVNSLQVYTALAKSALPDAIGELTGDEKAKAIKDYRTRMLGLLHAEIALEEAILKDDRAAAKDALAKLLDQQKDGHAQYGVDDKHH